MWKRKLIFTLAVVALFAYACSEDNPVVTPTPKPSPKRIATLEPSQDNTLYEDTAGVWSNGQGAYIFSGQNGTSSEPVSESRRALIAFDVASAIPAGSTIDSVFLTLNLSRRPPAGGDRVFNIHRVEKDWGEGASNAVVAPGSGTDSQPGDATWIHTFYDTATWTNPGGDFNPVISAARTVNDVGFYAWGNTANMVADVQMWLDNSAMNFGWIVIGDESADRTARRFDSRESATAGNRPKLRVHYTRP